MKKVLFVATVVKTHIMEFHIPYLQMFKEMGWETAVAAKNDYDNPEDCIIPYCDHYYNVEFDRTPFSFKNIKAYIDLKKLINENEYDIIHCHTPVGGVLARLAAQDARKNGTRVFYTAHGFHFYKGAPLINWLIYYPIERIMARKTDVLITINKEDYERAKDFKAKKIVYIPGVGIDIEKFKIHNKSREEMRNELGIPFDATVLLSVGEVNKNKNHRVVIEALPELDNCYYVLCGNGPLIEQHKKLADELGVSNRFIPTGYRTDLPDFYHMADVFVFPSLREGLPVALMEAMAAGNLCIAAENRGTKELITDTQFLFDANDKKNLTEKIVWAMENKCCISNNEIQFRQFDIKNVLELYKNELVYSV